MLGFSVVGRMPTTRMIVPKLKRFVIFSVRRCRHETNAHTHTRIEQIERIAHVSCTVPNCNCYGAATWFVLCVYKQLLCEHMWIYVSDQSGGDERGSLSMIARLCPSRALCVCVESAAIWFCRRRRRQSAPIRLPRMRLCVLVVAVCRHIPSPIYAGDLLWLCRWTRVRSDVHAVKDTTAANAFPTRLAAATWWMLTRVGISGTICEYRNGGFSIRSSGRLILDICIEA